jgi:hypothetical protein
MSANIQFMELFRGYELAHGEHRLNAGPEADGKLKGKAKTVKTSGATDADYTAHLLGKVSLGIIPLMKDSKCWFSSIDIDIEQFTAKRDNPAKLEARVRELELPLVVCLSKSQPGAHLDLFGSEPLPAELTVAKLTEWKALLGYPKAEIFPKQTTRHPDTVGNWINLPYYGALNGGTTRYCLCHGKPILDLGEFLKYAALMRVSAADLQKLTVPKAAEQPKSATTRRVLKPACTIEALVTHLVFKASPKGNRLRIHPLRPQACPKAGHACDSSSTWLFWYDHRSRELTFQCSKCGIYRASPVEPLRALAWIIHDCCSQKVKDALKGA